MRRLFSVLLCAFAFFTGLIGRAQDVDPLLAPHVQTYNSAIEALPASLVAGTLGFHRRDLFELADGRA